MKTLLYKWYDHDLIWDFYDRGFEMLYSHYDQFKQGSWEVDVYDGVDGEVIFVNDSISIPTQIKTSGKIRQYNLSVILAYRNEKGLNKYLTVQLNTLLKDIHDMIVLLQKMIGSSNRK